MKQDERDLLAALQHAQKSTPNVWRRESPRSIIARLGIPARRAEYIFDKWDRKGWYDWGTCIDMGWLTEDGEIVDTTR